MKREGVCDLNRLSELEGVLILGKFEEGIEGE